MIEIEAPDGSIVEFPDGTADDVMAKAMQQTYGAPQQQTSTLEAAGRGLEQGATLGFGDELQAGIGAGVASIGSALGFGDTNFSDAYSGILDNVRGQNQQAQQQNPVAFGVGELAGNVGSTGAALAKSAGKAATQGLTKRYGQAAAAGGATGAVEGAGKAQGNENILSGTAEGAGIGVIGGAAGQAAGDVLGGLYRRTLAPALDKEAFQAADAIGATPTVAQTLGGAAAASEAMLAQFPASGFSTRHAGQRQAKALSEGLQSLTSGASDSAEDAGNKLIDGLLKQVDNNEVIRDSLYADALKNVPQDAKMQFKETAQVAKRLIERFNQNPEAAQFAGTDILKTIKTITEKPLKLREAQRLKRSIWAKQKAALSGDVPDAALSADIGELYDAFNRDIAGSADLVSQEAGSAIRRADKMAIETFKLDEKIKSTLTGKPQGNIRGSSNNIKEPEKIWRNFLNATADPRRKSGASARQVRLLKEVIPSEQFNEVSMFTLRNMGLAKAGQEGVDDAFSPRTFITNWKNMAPDARKALFEDSLGKEEFKALGKLTGAIDVIGARSLNSSGTGAATAEFALGAGGFATGTSILTIFAPMLVGATSASKNAARLINQMPRDAFKKEWSRALLIETAKGLQQQ